MLDSPGSSVAVAWLNQDILGGWPSQVLCSRKTFLIKMAATAHWVLASLRLQAKALCGQDLCAAATHPQNLEPVWETIVGSIDLYSYVGFVCWRVGLIIYSVTVPENILLEGIQISRKSIVQETHQEHFQKYMCFHSICFLCILGISSLHSFIDGFSMRRRSQQQGVVNITAAALGAGALSLPRAMHLGPQLLCEIWGWVKSQNLKYHVFCGDEHGWTSRYHYILRCTDGTGFWPRPYPNIFWKYWETSRKSGCFCISTNFTVELWALGHFFAELVRCFAKVLLRYFVGTFVTWQWS